MGTIGLGMAALGRPEYINIKDNSLTDNSITEYRANAYKVLDLAYDNGIRFFDTAPSYGKGEAFLMEWMQLRKHKDVVLSTKWGYTYVANWEIGYTGAHEIKEHSLNKLDEQWETSKNLLPELAVYQIHSATFESGVLENKLVLERLYEIKQKYGLKIGLTVSGSQQKELVEAAAQIDWNGVALFDSFQVTYNLFEQSCFEQLHRLKKAGKFVIVKEGLANGRIFRDADKNNIVLQIAEKYKVGSDAVALRFVLDSLDPDIVLSGASNNEHLVSNLNTREFSLSPQELSALKALSMPAQDYWSERSKLPWH